MNDLIRNVDVILADVKPARISKKLFVEPMDQLIADLEVVLGETIVELGKFKDNSKEAGKKVRKYTLALDTLGRSFRKASVL